MLSASLRALSLAAPVSLALVLGLNSAARAQDLSLVDVSGEWEVKLTANFAPNAFGVSKVSGKGTAYLKQVGGVVTGLLVDKLGKCQAFELPGTGLRIGDTFTIDATGPTIDLITCATIGEAITAFTATLEDGAEAAATGTGTASATALGQTLTLDFTSTSTLKRKSGLQDPDDPDGSGPGLPLSQIGKGEPGVGGVHDLALYKLTVPKKVKAKAGPVTKVIKVQIQNRSQHTEVITDAAMLAAVVELSAEVVGGDAELPVLVPRPVKESKFPIMLKPKQKLTVQYDATFAGPVDLLAPGKEGTLSYTARVNHHELAGAVPDGHPEDDVAPRSVIAPFTFDTFPDGKVKEKGVGAKKSDKTFGDPILSVVTVGVL